MTCAAAGWRVVCRSWVSPVGRRGCSGYGLAFSLLHGWAPRSSRLRSPGKVTAPATSAPTGDSTIMGDVGVTA
jgi:hypothetical protein